MLSVIVPVYNTEKYLSRCFDSVLKQTYQNLELIIVDDGSTDNSSVICDSYEKQDNRVQVFHQKNGGQSSARNLGLLKATGEYVTFLDSDDWLELNTYEEVFKRIDDTGADMVMFNFVSNYGDSEVENRIDITEYSETQRIKKGFLWDRIGSQCRNVYKADLWQGVKFPLNCYYEDLAILIDVVMRAKKIEIIDKCFYHYDCTQSNSTTTNWNAKIKYGMYIGAIKRIEYADKFEDRDAKFDNLMWAYRTSVTGLSMNLYSRQLWPEQVKDMMNFINSDYTKEEINVGVKYKLLRWSLLHCRIISLFYGWSMAKLLYMRKLLKRVF